MMEADPQLARMPRSAVIGSGGSGLERVLSDIILFCFVLRPPAQICDMGKRLRNVPLLKEKNSEEKQT